MCVCVKETGRDAERARHTLSQTHTYCYMLNLMRESARENARESARESAYGHVLVCVCVRARACVCVCA